MLVPWISKHTSYRNNIEPFTTPVSVDGIGCFDVKHPPGTMSCYYSSDVSSVIWALVCLYFTHLLCSLDQKLTFLSLYLVPYPERFNKNKYIRSFICVFLYIYVYLMIYWIPEPSVPPAPVRTLIPMIHRERSVQRTAEGQDSLPHHQHTPHWFMVPHSTLVHGSTHQHWYTVPHTSTVGVPLGSTLPDRWTKLFSPSRGQVLNYTLCPLENSNTPRIPLYISMSCLVNTVPLFQWGVEDKTFPFITHGRVPETEWMSGRRVELIHKWHFPLYLL